MKIAAIVLIVAGVLALAYGGFSYTREKKVIDLGPSQARRKPAKRYPIPPIIGARGSRGGIIMLVMSSRKRS